MKTFFLVTSVLFGILLLFFLIYNFFFKNNPFDGKIPNVAVIPNDGSLGDDETEKAAPKKIAPLTEGETRSLFFDKASGTLLYLSPDDRSLREFFPLTGDSKTVTEFPFVPADILWSPDARRALVKKGEMEWGLFSRETKEVKLLKSGIESPAWTSLGDRIVYKYYDPATKTRTINIADPDGSNWQVIGETTIQFLEMKAIPQSSRLALWNRGNSLEKTKLQSISTVGGNAEELFSANYGADYLFSPNGTKILLSNVIEQGGSDITLALLNGKGGNYQNLFIPSLVGKAVWSENSRMIYYALPGSIPPGSVLPNDYYRKPIFTTDTFWKVDTETGEKSRIVDPVDIDQNYDAEDLVFDSDEAMLFFRNRHDGKLYRIAL